MCVCDIHVCVDVPPGLGEDDVVLGDDLLHGRLLEAETRVLLPVRHGVPDPLLLGRV